MAFFDGSAIRGISQSLQMERVSDSASEEIATDVEFRLREVLQEAMKFMRHGRRSTLTTGDVNRALELLNIEPAYGLSRRDPLRFLRAAGHPDVYYLEDLDLNMEELIEGKLPRPLIEATVVIHWLAIDGTQPKIPENAPLTSGRRSKRAKVGQETGNVSGKGKGVDNAEEEYIRKLIPPMKHLVSSEMQQYMQGVVSILRGDDRPKIDAAIASLRCDPGLHPLLPYFAQWISDDIGKNLKNIDRLSNLLNASHALLQNDLLNVEPYLHQLMPPILTCLVAKRIGAHPAEDHWTFRSMAANVASTAVRKFGKKYPSLQSRITNTLLKALLDPSKPLTTHFGAIVGLSALGKTVVQEILLPHCKNYMAVLLEEACSPSISSVRKNEIYNCLRALSCSVGTCVYVLYCQAMSKYYGKQQLPSGQKYSIAVKEEKIEDGSSADFFSKGAVQTEYFTEQLSEVSEWFGDDAAAFFPTAPLGVFI